MNCYIYLHYSRFCKVDVNTGFQSLHTGIPVSTGLFVLHVGYYLDLVAFPWRKLSIIYLSRPERHGLEQQTCDFAQGEGPDGPEFDFWGEVITESELLIHLQENRKQKRHQQRSSHPRHKTLLSENSWKTQAGQTPLWDFSPWRNEKCLTNSSTMRIKYPFLSFLVN